MAETPQRSPIDIIDILFAVVIGVGFELGLYDMRAEIATLAIFADADRAQHFARLIFAFVVVTASWFVYRASSSGARPYRRPEFAADVLVYFTYLPLFMFVEHPVAYYACLTAVWVIYAISWAAGFQRSMTGVVFYLAFIALFASLWASAVLQPSPEAEWARIAGAVSALLVYRLLQLRLKTV